MLLFKPANLYASIGTEQSEQKEPEKTMARSEVLTVPIRDSEIQVTATSKITLPPDSCKCTINLMSRKDQAQDAKNSVQRRLDYVLQTLNNHQVNEKDIYVTKILQRQGGFYIMEAEVLVNFNDFNKCQSVVNILVEKLDDSVKISQPMYYHSPNSLEYVRRQASLSALKNAKQKAAEMASFLGARVGKVIGVREEFFDEWEGASHEKDDVDVTSKVQQRIQNSVVHITVKIVAVFELKSKKK